MSEPVGLGSLRLLAAIVNKTNRDHGFPPATTLDWLANTWMVPGKIALIHSEASEALEAFRENNREHFAEELADILIRTLDLAGGLEIDIDKAVSDKMIANAERPYQHGGKRI